MSKQFAVFFMLYDIGATINCSDGSNVFYALLRHRLSKLLCSLFAGISVQNQYNSNITLWWLLSVIYDS